MKKFFKFLGTAAAVAALVPYQINNDGGRLNAKGLFWTATGSKRSTPDGPERKLDITIEFNNPFARNQEAHLFADDLTVDYAAPGGEPSTECATGSTEAAPPQAPDAPEAPAAPEAPREDAVPEAPAAPENTAGEADAD